MDGERRRGKKKRQVGETLVTITAHFGKGDSALRLEVYAVAQRALARTPKTSSRLRRLAQFQWALVFDVFNADGAELVPEVQNHGDDDGHGQADSEENPVGGEQDQKGNDGGDGDEEGGAAFHGESRGRHTAVL